MQDFTRRKVLALGAMGVAMPWVTKASAQERKITVAAYSDIFEDIYKKTVIEPFMKANPGIRVDYMGMPTSAQNLGMLRAQRAAPQIDVCIMDVVVAKAGGDEGIYKPVTAEQLPVMKELVPAALIEGVPGPAVTFDTIVMMYALNKFPTPPTSWRELWNKQHAGRIAIDAPPNLLGVGLTLIANKLAGGGDYRQSIDKGIQLLGEMAPLVQTWDPKPNPYAALANGVVDLGIGYNARAQTVSKQNPDRMAVAMPEEGSIAQINTINLVNGSKQPEAALQFMSHALSPEAQSAFTEALYYVPTNKGASISEEARKRTAATPERMARMIDVDWIEVAKFRDKITEQWRRNVISRS
ncbi:ABC transporter substrate-binding protein [Bradyrhizobium sp. KB893862 SZCCT0404]|uniref:ABC transporter substrate-binding protein n=1 Tax=Bradyrhizobium sp. KB893862 SZCCT0404 TaxID=2807672 RepID=UPI001BAC2F16|nr:ABC transporter substrate-binding protein [Bradyrhizobium sp. KB893862 SZCCT0404]MBR1175200.1 ABC transporter substrate-binding protein [Bradyrhizobium sp. KB893862 SZCCT0404]